MTSRLMTDDEIVDEAIRQGFGDAPDLHGAALLDEVRAFITRYVVLPDEGTIDAITLWTVHTHLVDAFESSPRLALLSPEPASGKTRTLEVLELLVPRPMFALGASAAAVFRSIESEQPTLLFDEVDTIFHARGKDDPAEDLRGVLNSGHRRGATVPRCVGPLHLVARFPVYAAAALAGLGDLPETLMSRSLVVRLRRRVPTETIEPFRRRVAAPEGERVRDRMAAWATQIAGQVRDAWPALPDGITDRPADIWEPLIAVADAAGGHWPDAARDACMSMCKQAAASSASLGIRLLADLRGVFGTARVMGTAEILTALCKLEEAPWANLRGHELDARGLASRLRQYEVKSTKVKIGDRSYQGYRADDLHDAWHRYLPPDPADPEPPEPAEPAWSQAPFTVPDDDPVPEPPADPEPPRTREVPQVPQVPDPAEGSAGSGQVSHVADVHDMHDFERDGDGHLCQRCGRRQSDSRRHRVDTS